MRLCHAFCAYDEVFCLQVPSVGLTKSVGFAKVCLQAKAALCFANMLAKLVLWAFS